MCDLREPTYATSLRLQRVRPRVNGCCCNRSRLPPKGSAAGRPPLRLRFAVAVWVCLSVCVARLASRVVPRALRYRARTVPNRALCAQVPCALLQCATAARDSPQRKARKAVPDFRLSESIGCACLVRKVSTNRPHVMRSATDRPMSCAAPRCKSRAVPQRQRCTAVTALVCCWAHVRRYSMRALHGACRFWAVRWGRRSWWKRSSGSLPITRT